MTGLVRMQDEIESHFNMRVEVYERAKADGKDEDRAQLLASIFRNCYFLGCDYKEVGPVVEESQKYWQKAWIEHYVSLVQS